MSSQLVRALLIIFACCALVCAQAPAFGVCLNGRATTYPIYTEKNVPQGTCGFGPVAQYMPLLFQQGFVTAPSENFYNYLNASGNWYGDVFTSNGCYSTQGNKANTKGVICGGGCGDCFEVTGPLGSQVFMLADIDDIGAASNPATADGWGNPVNFDLNRFDNGTAAWSGVAYGLGYLNVVWKKVVCPVAKGGVGIYFPEGSGSNQYSFAVTPFNYPVQILKIEAQGAGPGVAANNTWSELPRTWTNKFEWRLTNTGGPKTYGAYNGGDMVQLRITSIYNETIIYDPIKLPSNPIQNGQTFTTSQLSNGPACVWYPPPLIYDEEVIPSGNNNYQFEGMEFSRWSTYGSWGSNPNYQSTSNCYNGKYCVKWGINAGSAGLQFGYSNAFDSSLFNTLEFYIKSDTAYSQGVSMTWDGQNLPASASGTFNTGPIGTSWSKVSIALNSINATQPFRVLKFLFVGPTPYPDIMLDSIRLVVTANENADLSVLDGGVGQPTTGTGIPTGASSSSGTRTATSDAQRVASVYFIPCLSLFLLTMLLMQCF